MPTSAVAELLASWRAAERAWEAMSPEAPGFREVSIAVLRAWLAYQVATEPAEPGSFALVADDDHRYVAISAGVTAVLGYEPAELLGRLIDDIAAPDLAAATPDRWRAFLAEGRQDGEFRLIAKDGSVVPVRFQARAHYPIPGFHLSRLAAL